VVKPQRPAGRGHGATRDPGQTTALAGGPATSLWKREGERGLVGSREKHTGRGLGAVPCYRQLQVREHAVNDDGVVIWFRTDGCPCRGAHNTARAAKGSAMTHSFFRSASGVIRRATYGRRSNNLCGDPCGIDLGEEPGFE